MTDITITDITTGAIDGDGVFDKLMASVRLHIQEEYDNGRIKGTDYANVYLGAVQAVLGQSIQYAMQEEQTEAQVDLVIAQKDELLLNGVKDRELKDVQIVGAGYDNQVKAEQVTMATFERTYIQPTNLEKLEEEIDLLQTQESELGLNGIKDRLLKDAQTTHTAKQTEVAERGMAEQELTGTKQREDLTQSTANKVEEGKVIYTGRVKLDKETAMLEMDNAMTITKAAKVADPAYVYEPQYEI